MKRVLVVTVMVIMLMAVSVSAANAAWWLDLVCTDNPAGPSGNQFDVVYHEDAPELSWSTCNIFFTTPENPGAADVSMLGGSGGFAGWMVLAIGDDGADGARINEMVFTNPNPADGDLVCSITLANPGSVYWDSANAGFVCNVGGVNNGGPAMMAGDNLWVNGISAGPGGSGLGDAAPAPPIPEIITIVLIALGLAAIGGYVWYRRNRMAKIAA